MGSHAGGPRRECEGGEQSQAALLQLQSPALPCRSQPHLSKGLAAAWVCGRSPSGEACACPTPSFHSPSVWAVLPPPSSSALVLADHVPLSLCQGQKTGWGFCLLLLYRWLGEGSRVSLLLGKTSIQA